MTSKIFFAALMLLVLACGTVPAGQSAQVSTPVITPTEHVEPTATLAPTEAPTEPPDTSVQSNLGQQEQQISRADLGNDWPFTVDDGVVSCIGSGGIGEVYFATGGTTYAVNGNAIEAGKQADIRESAIFQGANLLPIIDRGLALCK